MARGNRNMEMKNQKAKSQRAEFMTQASYGEAERKAADEQDRADIAAGSAPYRWAPIIATHW